MIQKHHDALVKIANLKNMKQMRGLFLSGAPEHLVSPDDFEPIHPLLLEGLKIAAKIAEDCLEEGK